MEFLGNLNIPVILGWIFSVIAIGVPIFLFVGMYLDGRKNKTAVPKTSSDSSTAKRSFGIKTNKKQANTNNKELIVKSSGTSKESQVASIFGAPQQLQGFSMPSVGSKVQMPIFDNSEEEGLPPARNFAPAPPVLGTPRPKERPMTTRAPILPPPPKNLK